MKTIDDFKIIDGVAILSDVKYAEEAKVVDVFLKNNPKIKYGSVYTKDNKNYELKDGRLLFTKEKRFINPYYQKGVEDVNIPMNIYTKSQDVLPLNNFDKPNESKDLEKRIIFLENKVSEYQDLLKDISHYINNKIMNI